jgi:hypothetical protein
MTTLERNLEETLSSAEDIRFFRGYLQGLLDSGKIAPDRLEVILRRVYERLRDAGDEGEMTDLVLDGLDFLTGWCGPGMSVVKRESA